ncbi:unnamed protein product [Anisakis simplex]|uniref:Uncharacterized protein n=1 Tax=Anisakis simplex TaxID=6269 RepID=A0A0M3K6L9_ANISI|nr:unnamed protein product [Anisakis simplex]
MDESGAFASSRYWKRASKLVVGTLQLDSTRPGSAYFFIFCYASSSSPSSSSQSYSPTQRLQAKHSQSAMHWLAVLENIGERMTSNQSQLPRRLSQDPSRRTSLAFRQSYCEGHGSFCSGSNAKCPLQNSLSVTARKRAAVNSTGGQLFLCVIGSLLSFSICIWLTAFSQDLRWRRLLFAAGAALCALLFAMLAIQTMRKAKQPPIEEAIPNLAHRRSTIARSGGAKKSICSGMIREDSQSGGGGSGGAANSGDRKDAPTSVVVSSGGKRTSLT